MISVAEPVIKPQPGRLTLTPLSTIKPKPVRWVWDTTAEGDFPTSGGRFPLGKISLAAGKAERGKSQFCMWIAAQISNGTLPGCFHGEPKGVVYCATEDSFSETIVPRLMVAGADMSRVYRIDSDESGEEGYSLFLPRDYADLEQLIADYDIGAVIFDPLVSVLDADKMKPGQLRTQLEPIKVLFERTNAMALGIAFYRKMEGSDPLMQIAGGADLGQVIRAAVAFEKSFDDDGEPIFVMSQIKNNLGNGNLPSLMFTIEPWTVQTDDGPAYVSRLKWGGESSASVGDILTHGGAEHALGAIGKAMEWLSDYLSRNPWAESAAVIKAGNSAGHSRNSLYEARKRLGVLKEGGGGKDRGTARWALPGAAPRKEYDLASTGI